MPEIKNTFTGGKMEKDLDERIVPQGVYREALNIGVSTSEDSDVGALQNILGNIKVTEAIQGSDYSYVANTPNPGDCLYQQDTITFVNGRYYGINDHIASIADPMSDKIYRFVASTSDDSLTLNTVGNPGVWMDRIIEYDTSKAVSDVWQDKERAVFVDVYKVQSEIHKVGNAYAGCDQSQIEICHNSLQLKWGMVISTDNLQLAKKVYIKKITYSGAKATIYTSENIDNLIAIGDNISFHSDRVLNFSKERNITAINIIDGMIFWTDNHSEPKKINIKRSKLGSNSFQYGSGYNAGLGSNSSSSSFTSTSPTSHYCSSDNVCFSDFDQHTKLIVEENVPSELVKNYDACPIDGCTDPLATNYDPDATVDDGSCTYPILGCTDSDAFNYNSQASIDDGSCLYNGCINNAVGDNPDIHGYCSNGLFVGFDANGNPLFGACTPSLGYEVTNYNPNLSYDCNEDIIGTGYCHDASGASLPAYDNDQVGCEDPIQGNGVFTIGNLNWDSCCDDNLYTFHEEFDVDSCSTVNHLNKNINIYSDAAFFYLNEQQVINDLIGFTSLNNIDFSNLYYWHAFSSSATIPVEWCVDPNRAAGYAGAYKNRITKIELYQVDDLLVPLTTGFDTQITNTNNWDGTKTWFDFSDSTGDAPNGSIDDFMSWLQNQLMFDGVQNALENTTGVLISLSDGWSSIIAKLNNGIGGSSYTVGRAKYNAVIISEPCECENDDGSQPATYWGLPGQCVVDMVNGTSVCPPATACVTTGCTDNTLSGYNILTGYADVNGYGPDAVYTTDCQTPDNASSITYYGSSSPVCANHPTPCGVAGYAVDNYDPCACIDDNSCSAYWYQTGCTDSQATNWNAAANIEDGSCMYMGCTDPTANNYITHIHPSVLTTSYQFPILPGVTAYGSYSAPVSIAPVIDDGSCAYPPCQMGLNIPTAAVSYPDAMDGFEQAMALPQPLNNWGENPLGIHPMYGRGGSSQSIIDSAIDNGDWLYWADNTGNTGPDGSGGYYGVGEWMWIDNEGTGGSQTDEPFDNWQGSFSTSSVITCCAYDGGFDFSRDNQGTGAIGYNPNSTLATGTNYDAPHWNGLIEDWTGFEKWRNITYLDYSGSGIQGYNFNPHYYNKVAKWHTGFVSQQNLKVLKLNFNMNQLRMGDAFGNNIASGKVAVDLFHKSINYNNSLPLATTSNFDCDYGDPSCTGYCFDEPGPGRSINATDCLDSQTNGGVGTWITGMPNMRHLEMRGMMLSQVDIDLTYYLGGETQPGDCHQNHTGGVLLLPDDNTLNSNTGLTTLANKCTEAGSLPGLYLLEYLDIRGNQLQMLDLRKKPNLHTIIIADNTNDQTDMGAIYLDDGVNLATLAGGALTGQHNYNDGNNITNGELRLYDGTGSCSNTSFDNDRIGCENNGSVWTGNWPWQDLMIYVGTAQRVTQARSLDWPFLDTNSGQSKFCACIQDQSCYSGAMDLTTKNCTGNVLVDNTSTL